MKLSLVVASGVHEGKVIAVPIAEFRIGRDEDCHLRPSSPAISKRHCAVAVKGGKVFVRDLGSTNGTFVNDEQIDGETEVRNGDRLKAGPLDFVVRIEVPTAKSPAVKPTGSAQAISKPTPPPTAPPTEPEISEENESEQIAAMLLSTDDNPAADPSGEPSIPDGTTAMEIPALPGQPGAKVEKAKEEMKSTSSAAEAILKKYMRRPRN